MDGRNRKKKLAHHWRYLLHYCFFLKGDVLFLNSSGHRP